MRRLGGAYGGKFSHSVACAAAITVCANKLNRPVKMVVAMQTNMETFGKRCPYLVKWKVQYMCMISNKFKLNEYLPQIRSGYNVQFMFYLGWSIKRCKIEIC